MAHDRVTQLFIRNVRVFEDVTIDLKSGEGAAPTVLIGENGAGKSTVVAVCEILRQLGSARRGFVSDTLLARHGGPASLLRFGTRSFEIGAMISATGEMSLGYRIEVAEVTPGNLTVARELFWYGEGPENLIFERAGNVVDVRQRFGSGHGPLMVYPDEPILTSIGNVVPNVRRMLEALESIAVYPGFATEARWVRSDPARDPSMRVPSPFVASPRLDARGTNLAACLQQLRNEHVHDGGWHELVVRFGLGLGEHLVDVVTRPVGAPGMVGFELKMEGLDKPIPSEAMSDGQLGYLAIATIRSLAEYHPPSLVVFDEFDRHLHPHLAARAAWDLEALAESCPVIATTHSDRVLDSLHCPERAVVLARFDSPNSASLVRPDATALAEWLEDYRGLGTLRSEGYAPFVFPMRDIPLPTDLPEPSEEVRREMDKLRAARG